MHVQIWAESGEIPDANSKSQSPFCEMGWPGPQLQLHWLHPHPKSKAATDHCCVTTSRQWDQSDLDGNFKSSFYLPFPDEVIQKNSNSIPNRGSGNSNQVKPDLSHTTALTRTLVQHVLHQNLQLQSKKARNQEILVSKGVKNTSACSEAFQRCTDLCNHYNSLFIHTDNFNWNGVWPQQGLFQSREAYSL